MNFNKYLIQNNYKLYNRISELNNQDLIKKFDLEINLDGIISKKYRNDIILINLILSTLLDFCMIDSLKYKSELEWSKKSKIIYDLALKNDFIKLCNYKQENDLSKKIKKGLEKCKLNGKKIGRPSGTMKNKELLEKYSELSKDIKILSLQQCMKIHKVSKNTVIKVKKAINLNE